MDDEMLNQSEQTDSTDPGDVEVMRRLEAFAENHLSPSVGASTRLRTGVMNAAHQRAALMAADATSDPPALTTAPLAADRPETSRRAWRRPLVAIMAGCLTLGILAGTALAAKPGGPFYQARIWTEMATLPADVPARAQAEVHRLEDRLQEAQQASTDGDGPATEAALVAYSTIVLEAELGTDGDPAAAATLEVNVTRHVVVLTLMVDRVPAPARDALRQALASSTKVLDDLKGSGQGAGAGQGAGTGHGLGAGDAGQGDGAGVAADGGDGGENLQTIDAVLTGSDTAAKSSEPGASDPVTGSGKGHDPAGSAKPNGPAASGGSDQSDGHAHPVDHVDPVGPVDSNGKASQDPLKRAP